MSMATSRVTGMFVACFAIMALSSFLAAGVLAKDASPEERKRKVKATAYTSRKQETDSTPHLTACEDKIKPGDKTVAVSEDLFNAGLGCGAVISIEGLEGDYIVNDRTGDGKRNQIDVYFGKDVQAAKEWGEKEVNIFWDAGGAAKVQPAP